MKNIIKSLISSEGLKKQPDGHFLSRKLIIHKNNRHGPMTWDDAKGYLDLLGNGWRLPTKNELEYLHKIYSEFELTSNQLMDILTLHSNIRDVYWSSTTEDSDPGFAYAMDIRLDRIATLNKGYMDDLRWIWPVKSA